MKPKKTALTTVVCLAFGLLVFLCANAKTAQAQQVQVSAADPAMAAQGTINLNVKVTGKGFKNGAKAKWFVTGTTDPGGVQVNSTTFVNSGELMANITVADTALIANFDIAVTNADGRGGKGTELFAVTAKGANKVTDVGVSARFVYCAPPGSDSASQLAYAACVQQNRVRNDFDLDYINGLEGVAAVFNIVSGTNDLTINLSTATRRTVMDFYDLIPESSGQTIPAWHTTPQYGQWFFNVQRAYLVRTFCSGSYPCDMISTMTSSGTVSVDTATYYLQWKPDSAKPLNSPETTSQVNVHYDKVNGVEVWTITPLPNITSQRMVAGLLQEPKGHGKITSNPAGQYLVPFRLTVSPR